MYHHILVPVDGSKTSEEGLREALALARDQGAELRVVYVIDPSKAAADMLTAAEYGSVHEELREQGKKVLAHARQLARRRSVSCDTVMRECTQQVADAIVEEARTWPCELIVMGTHGRQGLRHLLMGSTAEGVLRHAPVPVLLVRPPH